ncbi:DoxX family membrane protein [Microbacterium sp. BLY]|uniref:DoxX family membrane protein n=1 Tax=Microbacterium sp. BLY TaxID=2823280 RepID=UPI001B3237BB|nr:DoxX family membrane protein [Microbacterium sp. BLY]MBP3976600.1 DoxX family membrane protein [Microbacterium sp. BLY]
MTALRSARLLIGPLLGAAARVAVGVLWLIEGTLKYRSGFGAADIELVAQSAQGNTRVPDFFDPLGAAMTSASALFGVAIPALEVGLGVLLVSGLLTRTAAFVSIGTLALYWSADQLIAQYPVMVVLSATVLVFVASGRFGVDGWVRARRAKRPVEGPGD